MIKLMIITNDSQQHQFSRLGSYHYCSINICITVHTMNESTIIFILLATRYQTRMLCTPLTRIGRGKVSSTSVRLL
jgi:hypothetical protein